MKRVLLDENVPIGLRRSLVGYDVWHVRDTGWAGLSNGHLIAAAEKAGFDVMITADRNLRHQQNLVGRRLALVVIASNAWPIVRRNIGAIAWGVSLVQAGAIQDVPFDLSS